MKNSNIVIRLSPVFKKKKGKVWDMISFRVNNERELLVPPTRK